PSWSGRREAGPGALPGSHDPGLSEKSTEGFDAALDRVIVDVQVGDQAHARQVADAGAHAGPLQVRVEGTQALDRHVDEDHVGKATLHMQRLDATQAIGQASCARMVFSKTRDMMLQCMQSGSSQQTGPTHSA